MVLTFSLIILGLLGLCQCHLRLSCELAKFMSREDYRAVAGTNYEAQCSSVTSRELEEAAAYLGGTGGRRRRRRRRRGPRSVPGLPPVITIAGEKPQCRQCELTGSLCLLFGLGEFELGEESIILAIKQNFGRVLQSLLSAGPGQRTRGPALWPGSPAC